MADQSDRNHTVNSTPRAEESLPGQQRLTIPKRGNDTNLLPAAPYEVPPLTNALDRDPIMDGAVYRGNMALESRASVVLQFKPSGLCCVLPLIEPETVGRLSDVLNLPLMKAQRHGVSREHCRFRREGKRLLVTDLGSTNGTYLNGEQMNPQQDYELADGDQMAFGTLHLTIHFSVK